MEVEIFLTIIKAHNKTDDSMLMQSVELSDDDCVTCAINRAIHLDDDGVSIPWPK